MTGKGGISRAPRMQIRLVVAMQAIWLSLVCVLGAWWVTLSLKQASEITALKRMAGISPEQIALESARTHRMLMGESMTFFALLISITAVLIWLYWREMMRTRSIQAFFASVTHELRTPLTSIRLQAETIAESLEKNPQEKELVRRLLEDTGRLESQVERTLELARVEGGASLFSQAIPIRPWIDRTLASWKETYGSRLSVQCDVPETLVASADASALQVILKNLLENSIRHSKKNPVQVLLNAEKRNGAVALHFQDNGEGFTGDTSKLGRLFEKGPNSQGAGVGLYLVRVLMQRMGGRADFDGAHGFHASLWFKEGQSHG